MENQTLNIEHHKKLLILNALNKFDDTAKAAAALKIAETTLLKSMYNYNIMKESIDNGPYIIKQKKITMPKFVQVEKKVIDHSDVKATSVFHTVVNEFDDEEWHSQSIGFIKLQDGRLAEMQVLVTTVKKDWLCKPSI